MATNYIQTLQDENKALKAKLAGLEKTIDQFALFLHSPKFTGTEPDGGRKDWIATGDVLSWLQGVRLELMVD